MTILATDNFTRADNADLGTAWDPNTADSDANGFDITSNAAHPVDSNADSSESNNSVAFPNDQYCEVTFGTTFSDGAGAGCGGTCRALQSVKTFYRGVGNASGYEFMRFNAGTGTSLSTGTGTTFTAGDKLRIETKTNGANCDWILKKNGSQFASGSDTSPLASGRTGIAHSSTSTSVNVSITFFEAGDFGSTAPSLMGQVCT